MKKMKEQPIMQKHKDNTSISIHIFFMDTKTDIFLREKVKERRWPSTY